MKLKGVSILVSYPDDEVEAAVPTEMTTDQLVRYIEELTDTEPDMTSFVITACVAKD